MRSKEPKRKFFILEDSEDRIKEFKERLKKEGKIFITKNVKEAKKIFKTEGPWDMIFLDHDLEGKAFVDVKDPNTGSAFCEWLAGQLSPERPPLILVHSANEVGARNMMAILKDKKIKSYRTPFVWLNSEFGKLIQFS